MVVIKPTRLRGVYLALPISYLPVAVEVSTMSFLMGKAVHLFKWPTSFVTPIESLFIPPSVQITCSYLYSSALYLALY